MGFFGDAYGAVAGVADHAAGSVDESIGRQFDGEAGGGFVEVGDNVDDNTESVAGFDIWGESQSNPLLEFGPARTAYDYVFEYDESLNGVGDTEDLAGRNLRTTWRGTVDAAENASDLAGGPGNLAGLIMYAVVAIGALYLLGPVFNLLAALLGGGDT